MRTRWKFKEDKWSRERKLRPQTTANHFKERKWIFTQKDWRPSTSILNNWFKLRLNRLRITSKTSQWNFSLEILIKRQVITSKRTFYNSLIVKADRDHFKDCVNGKWISLENLVLNETKGRRVSLKNLTIRVNYQGLMR